MRSALTGFIWIGAQNIIFNLFVLIVFKIYGLEFFISP